ncbi:MAG: hypothetical protein KatS3mg129_1467 [Leptospiraceae bacterium]|nr:MAG: hypothetical protein KatS3mg129_1467 [Leptospiraceae bacterium]
MTQEIIDFLSKHYILTLCTYDGKNPYSAPLFYLFFNNALFFLSDQNTTHAKHILVNPEVSVSIFTYTREVKNIQGIQMMAICKFLEHTKNLTKSIIFNFKNFELDLKEIYDEYCKKFPEAYQFSSSLWGIFPYWIKYTNNQIQFGYKTIWRYEDDTGN